jgi:hypothetical protein
LKFLGELWAGRACAGANEVELTKVPKSGGRRKKWGGRRKNGEARRIKWDLRTADPWSATRDHGPVLLPHHCLNCFWNSKVLLGIWEEWVHSTPIFSSFPPTLGSVKSSIPRRVWRFHFFPSFIFAKFRLHLDLHIHHWDFCSMKK